MEKPFGFGVYTDYTACITEQQSKCNIVALCFLLLGVGLFLAEYYKNMAVSCFHSKSLIYAGWKLWCLLPVVLAASVCVAVRSDETDCSDDAPPRPLQVHHMERDRVRPP